MLHKCATYNLTLHRMHGGVENCSNIIIELWLMSMSARMALTMCRRIESLRSGTALLTWQEIVNETERNRSVFRIQPAVSEERPLVLFVELVHQGLDPAFLLPINARQVVDNTNTVLSQASARRSEHLSSCLAREEPNNDLPRLAALRLTNAVRVLYSLAGMNYYGMSWPKK